MSENCCSNCWKAIGESKKREIKEYHFQSTEYLKNNLTNTLIKPTEK